MPPKLRKRLSFIGEELQAQYDATGFKATLQVFFWYSKNGGLGTYLSMRISWRPVFICKGRTSGRCMNKMMQRWV